MFRYIPIAITAVLLSFYYYCYYSIWTIKIYTWGSYYIIWVFHAIFGLSMISMLTVVFTNPGKIPDNFSISTIPKTQKVNHPDDIIPKFYLLGRIGYCTNCKKDRPHRAHHCKRCKTCILRYDHHCHFLNNCIGLRNHKAFILFLVYLGISSLICTFHIGTIIIEGYFEWKFLFFMIAYAVVAILSLGFGLIHGSNVCLNSTGLEQKWKIYELFDQGLGENFKQVFGDKCFLWPIPFDTSKVNGLLFPMKIKTIDEPKFIHIDKYLI